RRERGRARIQVVQRTESLPVRQVDAGFLTSLAYGSGEQVGVLRLVSPTRECDLAGPRIARPLGAPAKQRLEALGGRPGESGAGEASRELTRQTAQEDHGPAPAGARDLDRERNADGPRDLDAAVHGSGQRSAVAVACGADDHSARCPGGARGPAIIPQERREA